MTSSSNPPTRRDFILKASATLAAAEAAGGWPAMAAPLASTNQQAGESDAADRTLPPGVIEMAERLAG
ncbi:MAG: hypothetical protein RJA16_970, partial [Planctomycetota bacterium]